jgi:hypothetical protein
VGGQVWCSAGEEHDGKHKETGHFGKENINFVLLCALGVLCGKGSWF